MVARPACMVMGVALNVPPWGMPGDCRVASKASMMSVRPPKAPTGSPPPIIFPMQVRSGNRLNHCWAPPGLIRKVCTSSKISSVFWPSHASRYSSVVEGEYDDISQRIGGNAARAGHGLWILDASGTGRDADASVIAGAVIAAFDLGNFGFARVGARRPYGQHHAFCTAIGKAQALH